jgi:hypothetical protein
MSEPNEAEIQLRDAIRNTPDAIEQLRAALFAGLKSEDIWFYQGEECGREPDRMTILNYIKAIVDIGDLSEVKFAGARDEVMQRLLEGRKRALEAAATSE